MGPSWWFVEVVGCWPCVESQVYFERKLLCVEVDRSGTGGGTSFDGSKRIQERHAMGPKFFGCWLVESRGEATCRK